MSRFIANHDPLLWGNATSLQRRALNDPARELSMMKRLFSVSYLQDANSGNPEAVMKIVSTGMGRGALSQLTAYIARSTEYMDDDEALALEDEFGNRILGKDAEQAFIDGWVSDFEPLTSYKDQVWKLELKNKLEFERAKLQYQGGDEEEIRKLNLALKREKITAEDGREVNFNFHAPKDITHIILSVGGENHNLKRATEATRRFLRDNFDAQGFSYVFVAHADTENLHFHVIVKNKNIINGRCLKFDRADLFTLRHDFAYHLKSLGIKRVATLRRDRVVTLKSIKAQKEELFERHDIFKEKYQQKRPINTQRYRNTALKKVERLQNITDRELKYSILTPARTRVLRANLAEITDFKTQLKREEQLLTPANKADEKEMISQQLQSEGQRLKAKSPRRSKRQKQYIKRYLQHFESEINEAIKYFKIVQKIAKTDTTQTRKQLKETKKALGLGWGLKLRF